MNIKSTLIAIAALLMLASCNNKLKRNASADDKVLYAVKQLKKNPNDAEARALLQPAYEEALRLHTTRISSLRNSRDLSRWDNISAQYQALQKLYDAISSSGAASRLVNAQDFTADMATVRDDAAEAYYNYGNTLLQYNDREQAKKAYYAFQKAGQYVDNYKDTRELMQTAYNNTIIDVVINPIRDNTYSYANWGYGYGQSPDYLSQSLVRDLGGSYNTQTPAHFYTERDARIHNILPQWVVEISLKEMNIPRPAESQYSRTVTKTVKVIERNGAVRYDTVSATLNITRRQITARGEMECRITDLADRRNISWNSYDGSANWETEFGTYTGDARALGNSEWAIINNKNTQPQREEILEEIYRKIYPQLKNRIENAVRW
jgi:hypothetical protein